jgi:hypothetical protein
VYIRQTLGDSKFVLRRSGQAIDKITLSAGVAAYAAGEQVTRLLEQRRRSRQAQACRTQSSECAVAAVA